MRHDGEGVRFFAASRLDKALVGPRWPVSTLVPASAAETAHQIHNFYYRFNLRALPRWGHTSTFYWRPMGKSGFFIAMALGALVLFVVFLPQLRQWWLTFRADEVTINYPSTGPDGVPGTLDLKIISILGRDGIPAILDPVFLDVVAGQSQMRPDERVLGVSINGDHRAYPLNLLSRHEIVNDTVGGVPIAVTW